MTEKLIVFNMNGMLTDGSLPVVEIMKLAVTDIKKPVAVISGATISEMRTALEPILNERDLYLLPEYGSSCFHSWMMLYDFSSPMPEGVFERINMFATLALEELDMVVPADLATKGHSQATISVLGKSSPLEEKREFDKNGAIRRKIIHSIYTLFDTVGTAPAGLEYTLAGHSSIDIREDSWDKRSGLITFMEYMGLCPRTVSFYGPSTTPGRAGWPARHAGTGVVEAKSMVDAFQLVRRLR